MKDYMIKYTTDPRQAATIGPWGHIVRGVSSSEDARDEFTQHIWTVAIQDIRDGLDPQLLYEIVSIEEIIAECTATLKETDE